MKLQAIQAIQKVEDYIKKLRWKATFLTQDKDQTELTYKVKDLPFKEDFIKLVKNLRFQKVDNKFQRMLTQDLEDIRPSNKTSTTTDKSSNMYAFCKKEYPNLFRKCCYIKV